MPLRWSRFCLFCLPVLFVSCAPEAPPPAAPASRPAAIEPAIEPPSESAAPDGLQIRLEQAIDQVRRRELLTTNGFWTIFHGVLGLGPGLVLKEPSTGGKVNALDYMFHGGNVRGMLFVPTDSGVDVLSVGAAGVEQYVGQGHQDQFLAEMIEWGVEPSRPILIYGKTYTFGDLVKESQARLRLGKKQELSWAIIAIGQTIGTDAAWTNRFGEKITYEQVAREELSVDPNAAACGGTHHLFGLTWAYYQHMAFCKRTGRTPTPVWKEIRNKLDQYQALAKSYQNRSDGLLSSSYFRGASVSPDPQVRLGSAGHTLEWLAQDESDKELHEPWMQDAAAAVAKLILDIRFDPMESGALYHAVHGLITYHSRMYGSPRKAAAAAATTPTRR